MQLVATLQLQGQPFFHQVLKKMRFRELWLAWKEACLMGLLGSEFLDLPLSPKPNSGPWDYGV